MRRLLTEIVEKAGVSGLPKSDLDNARELLKNNEFGLCLDVVVTQVYEHEILIEFGFYELLKEAAAIIGIPCEEIDFIRKLVRAD
ncbi:hypothetical protein [Flavihumibacter petaseus]|uniref:MafI family immunity protein n=1 Tax=Flavihumibacter petaseus NBRC 106054 TaxID=1220578 RepID=A0A0E9N3Q5_9BACT|nr:hypothetical protein [Flavihumibacter petaseus]GAO44444.1 hypothetical protein FPE01S_03_04810 [Flavihumibacter petaseus NBRC 106054]